MHEMFSMETIQLKELPLLCSGSRGGIALIVLSVDLFGSSLINALLILEK